MAGTAMRQKGSLTGAGISGKYMRRDTDLPPLNGTTPRERIWGWSKPREATNATRKEGTGSRSSPSFDVRVETAWRFMRNMSFTPEEQAAVAEAVVRLVAGGPGAAD
jgi:hypothetical protein